MPHNIADCGVEVPPNAVATAAMHVLQILGLWLWLSYRFEEGTFPGRERVQAMARQLSHWLNIGLQNIQSAAAREAAAGLQAVVDAVSAAERPSSSSSGSGSGGGYDSSSDGVDSSDADEINEAVFRTPVVEVAAVGADSSSSSVAAAAQAALGGLQAGSRSDAAQQQQQQQQQQRQQWRDEPQPVAYINWGCTVSTGISAAASTNGSAVFRSTAGSGSSSSSEWGDEATAAAAAVGVERLLPGAESLETSYAAGTNHSVEVLERLIMPEFDPSMAPFVRWISRPKFRPPPAPTAAAVGGS
jgi:hypothetical protein